LILSPVDHEAFIDRCRPPREYESPSTVSDSRTVLDNKHVVTSADGTRVYVSGTYSPYTPGDGVVTFPAGHGYTLMAYDTGGS
jgi:hypothetical protein